MMSVSRSELKSRMTASTMSKTNGGTARASAFCASPEFPCSPPHSMR